MKKMKFPKDMYYNDLSKPLYLKGEIYEVEDKNVQRWLNRGGEIVEDKVEPVHVPVPVPAPVAEEPIPVEPVPEVKPEPPKVAPKPNGKKIK